MDFFWEITGGIFGLISEEVPGKLPENFFVALLDLQKKKKKSI